MKIINVTREEPVKDSHLWTDETGMKFSTPSRVDSILDKGIVFFAAEDYITEQIF